MQHAAIIASLSLWAASALAAPPVALVLDVSSEMRSDLEASLQKTLPQAILTVVATVAEDDAALLALGRESGHSQLISLQVQAQSAGFELQARLVRAGVLSKVFSSAADGEAVKREAAQLIAQLLNLNLVAPTPPPTPARPKRIHPYGLLLGGVVALLLPYFATVGLAANYEGYNADAARRGYIPVAGPFLAMNHMSDKDLNAGYRIGLTADGAIQIVALNVVVAGVIYCAVGQKPGKRPSYAASSGNGVTFTW